MTTTEMLGLAELLNKDVATDARAIADQLASERTVPSGLGVRVRGIHLELTEVLAEAVKAGPEVARLAQVLAEPVQQLSTTLRAHLDLETPADRDQIRLGMLAVAQALEHFETTTAWWQGTPVSDLLRWFTEALGWSQTELAEAIQVDIRTVQRWIHGSSPGSGEEARLRALARISRPLRYAMTARGVSQWLQRPLAAVGERRPLDCLDDEAAIAELEQGVFALRG
jgi:transcriptional regulator with XRE-family HTH domain